MGTLKAKEGKQGNAASSADKKTREEFRHILLSSALDRNRGGIRRRKRTLQKTEDIGEGQRGVICGRKLIRGILPYVVSKRPKIAARLAPRTSRQTGCKSLFEKHWVLGETWRKGYGYP